jgi:endonuclease YncB( thermonuclease family)
MIIKMQIINKTVLVIAVILFFPLPALAASSSFTARVVSVADGDAITVLTTDNRQVKVRLYGINCPERRQPYGNRARQATSEAIHGKEVNVHPMDTDRYGRTVAIVAAPGREMLNSWLVKSGLAWVYERYCKAADPCDRLRELEREARAGKVGLWRDKAPVEPEEARLKKERQKMRDAARVLMQ